MVELFENFEINKTPRWPRLARTISGSVALHAIFVACALYVPAVRDALNIASAFGGIEFVSEDYKKMEVGDRAQIIELPSDRFRYPEGYFSTATPETTPPGAQIISVNYNPPQPVRPPKPVKPIPTPTPEPSPTVSPTPVAQASPSPTPANVADEVTTADKPLSAEEAEKKIDEVAAENNVERFPKINTKPFTDLLDEGKKMRDAGQLDLTGSIELIVEADRNPEDGTIISYKVQQTSGDPKLTKLAERFVAALSESGLLKSLKGADHLQLTVMLNETEIAVSVSSEVETEERAKEMERGYNALLFLAAASKSGRDEEAYFKSTKVSAKGKQVTVDFKMPRATMGALLSKQLAAS